MKKRRGSALLFTLLTSIAATTVILATVGSVTQEVQRQRLSERNHIVNASFDAVVNKVISEFAAGERELSAISITVAVNGSTWNVTMTDNSGSVKDSILVSGTGLVNGKIEYGRKVVPRPYLESPFAYGLTTMKDLNVTETITIGSALNKCDLWNEGKILGTGWLSVNGTLRSTSTVSNPGVTATSGIQTNRQERGIPPLDISLYKDVADRTISGGSYVGFTFAKDYEVVYVNGDFNMSGAIAGKGTIAAKGHIQFDADTSYADKNSRVVFLAGGEIRAKGWTSNIVGVLCSSGKLVIDGGLSVKLEPGVAVTYDKLDVTDPFTIGFDRFIADNPEEGPKYKLPGFWP
ncbi:MAG: hypothetical protein KJZ62_02435 [Fimbriimonadaceae bacterium]|nr:hypothetical protein [Fimbriimonadaceae bacterium]QOJ12757.1 MAG: hypothetical protein HRU74_12115 [Chthonomonadaceae bacterium]